MSTLLKEMQSKNTHMAIVVDEFNGVEGIVTMEDLIEEIVGEIHDETDPDIELFKKIDENTIMTDGDIEIDEINNIFKSNIQHSDDYSTLNGLLHEKLHDIPKVGDVVKISSLSIKIEQVEKNKPTSIRIQRILDEE